MIIGLTGSIAMGKSEAARYLAGLGLPVFDSDAEVHKLYDSPAGAALIRPFVPEATALDKVDRKLVTAAVMKDPGLLARLEKKVHAEIRARREAFIAQARRAQAKAVVLDIPLLFETGAQSEVNKTIVISSTPELQRARALARPGMTEERLALILSRQMPDAEKRKLADVVIENNGPLVDMQHSLLKSLREWSIMA
jgi:dephospho-CoA kinase